MLAIGDGPSFEPSASEWIERARAYARSDPPKARAIVDDLRARKPDSAGVEIAEALIAATRGDAEGAQRLLANAIAKDPRVREPLRHDPDLGELLPDGV